MIIKFKTMELGKTYEADVIIYDIAQRDTTSGKPMVTIKISDGDEIVSAIKFDAVKADLTNAGIAEGSTAVVSIFVDTYGGRSYKFTTVRPATFTQEELEKLVKRPPVEPDKLVDEILYFVKQSSGRTYDMTNLDVPADDTSITALAVRIITMLRPAFKVASAAKTMHHNIYGGLAYHTNRMVKAAYSLCNVYTLLDRELLVCGAALHDIGKLLELKTTNTGVATYTTDGCLFGHLLLGIEMIDKVCWDLKFKIDPDNPEGPKMEYNPEQVKMLKHMIASHHGTTDWGAIKLPSTPEAMALHELDMIDSRMYMYEENFAGMEPGTMSDPIFGISGDGKNPIYKNSVSDYN